eukprot:1856413-Pleurochrysis_carterae.AAC.1
MVPRFDILPPYLKKAFTAKSAQALAPNQSSVSREARKVAARLLFRGSHFERRRWPSTRTGGDCDTSGRE